MAADQDVYYEQAPMTSQPAYEDYQTYPEEEWTYDSYQQPVSNPSPPPYGRPIHPPGPYPLPMSAVYDSGSFGWAALGALFPLVGFVLFLAWEWRKPKSAKMAGIGALVSALAGIAFAITGMIMLVIQSYTFTLNLF